MTVGLAMLVRDEQHTVRPLLERIRGLVSCWTVIDTGSVDDTPRVVTETLDGLPGQLLHRPWVNFGHNRTELLQAARDTDAGYTLMLDADHVVHTEGDQPALNADSYMLRIRGPLEWRLPLLTRTQHPFAYRGAAHSYLASDAPTRTANTDWLSIDGGPGASRDKLERDRALLEQAFADNPGDGRTVFYLAQTYRDLDMVAEAIRFYLLRADMGGFAEEAYFARYQAGCLLSGHVSFAQGAEQLLQAWRSRPTRAEALRALANAANAVADKTPPPDDVLFVSPAAYGKAA